MDGQMELSSHQREAFDAVVDQLRAGHKHVCLEGYAGTGKTTIARKFMEGGAELLAPTGKAAARLRDKTGQTVSTIHARVAKIADDRVEGGRDVLRFGVSQAAKPFAGLVIVDEGSMVNAELGAMLEAKLAPGAQVLWLQDPFQLPPVDGEPFIDFPPAFVLTEVRRQQQASPTLAYATAIRSGQGASFMGWVAPGPRADGEFAYAAAVTVERAAGLALQVDRMTGSSVMLCHTNRMRGRINRECRRLSGLDGHRWPSVGEPIVCEKNIKGGPMNGEIFRVANVERSSCGRCVVEFSEHPGQPFVLRPEHMGQERRVSFMRDWYSLWGGPDKVPENAMICDFGYAVTVHKSQGSEWDVVAHVAERWAGNDPERLHYTAVTRAARGYLRLTPVD
jgi:exodeoxyribonuclease V